MHKGPIIPSDPFYCEFSSGERAENMLVKCVGMHQLGMDMAIVISKDWLIISSGNSGVVTVVKSKHLMLIIYIQNFQYIQDDSLLAHQRSGQREFPCTHDRNNGVLLNEK